MFQDQLCDGSAILVIRPELRECWSGNSENMGRMLTELRACPALQRLARWSEVERALSAEATYDWQGQWDAKWACGEDGAWQQHIEGSQRFAKFAFWLGRRP